MTSHWARIRTNLFDSEKRWQPCRTVGNMEHGYICALQAPDGCVANGVVSMGRWRAADKLNNVWLKIEREILSASSECWRTIRSSIRVLMGLSRGFISSRDEHCNVFSHRLSQIAVVRFPVSVGCPGTQPFQLDAKVCFQYQFEGKGVWNNSGSSVKQSDKKFENGRQNPRWLPISKLPLHGTPLFYSAAPLKATKRVYFQRAIISISDILLTSFINTSAHLAACCFLLAKQVYIQLLWSLFSLTIVKDGVTST